MEQPTTPQPLTPEQKINRAERLAKEAGDSKKSAFTWMFIAAIIIVIGIFFLVFSRSNTYKKAELNNAKDTGYVKDDGFLGSTHNTKEAVGDFYKKTGIPLYIYTMGQYVGSKDLSEYVEVLYDELFSDEDHVLILYCNNPHGWEYSSGAKAKYFFSDGEFNNLIDQIDKSADLYGNTSTYDEIMAKGIESYTKQLTSSGSNSKRFAVIILFVGGVIFIGAIFSYISKSGEEKRYMEEASTLRTEQMLSKPLETFGNREIENLKDKYD